MSLTIGCPKRTTTHRLRGYHMWLSLSFSIYLSIFFHPAPSAPLLMVPSQAVVLEAWEQRLKACPVFAKSTKVQAKKMTEVGELETVIKGVKETSRAYQAHLCPA